MKLNPEVLSTIPEAQIRRRTRLTWVWIIPLLSAAVIMFMFFYSIQQQGFDIQIQFRHGHGIKPGDVLRYRGIEIGSVRQVSLAEDLTSIEVAARLPPSARDLARQGSRFWIVRPQVGLSGISGLETVIGANYVGVLPGSGDYCQSFIGLETPPLMETLEGGGLEITLWSPNKGNLRAGAPVTYRQVVIGVIISVELARDAGSVEATAYILPDYTRLICEQARFWKSNPAVFSAGIRRGVLVQLDSLWSLMEGGVKLAIPPDCGKPAHKNSRFRLYDEPDSEWLDWVPLLDLRQSPAASDLPKLIKAQVSYIRFLLPQEKSAWVLPIKNGLLGPEDVLAADERRKSEQRSVQLHGTWRSLNTAARSVQSEVSIVPYPHAKGYKMPEPWPLKRMRRAQRPEDTIIIAGNSLNQRFVEKNRYHAGTGYWRIDPALPFDEQWHGACVIADEDKALIGMLLVEGKRAKVIPLVFFSSETITSTN